MATALDGPIPELRALPPDERGRRATIRAIALALGIPLVVAGTLADALPVALPLPGAPGERLREELAALGATVAPLELAGPLPPCADHDRLIGIGGCERCKSPLCTVCTSGARRPLCRACAAKASRSRAFFFARVAVLSVILIGVVLYAIRDVSSRAARTDWKSPVSVAIVLVAREPLDDDAGEKLRERSTELSARLADEMRRYRDASTPPFSFQVFGPVRDDGPVPEPPADDGIVAMGRYAWDLRSFEGRVDEAAKLQTSAFDSRIYLLATRPVRRDRKAIEGASQMGGRVGVVKVELDATMADFALIVSAHELFHTLGASDKYDAEGNPAIPTGLPEPDRQPLFPQPAFEIMARHRAVAANKSVPPKSLSELRVGAETAQEIRWRE